jgi:hypothetical protein
VTWCFISLTILVSSGSSSKCRSIKTKDKIKDRMQVSSGKRRRVWQAKAAHGGPHSRFTWRVVADLERRLAGRVDLKAFGGTRNENHVGSSRCPKIRPLSCQERSKRERWSEPGPAMTSGRMTRHGDFELCIVAAVVDLTKRRFDCEQRNCLPYCGVHSLNM